MRESTLFKNEFGLFKEGWIATFVVAGVVVFMSLLFLGVGLNPVNRSDCDVNKRVCHDFKTDTDQVCDGRDLIIKSFVRGGESVAVRPDSVKCLGVER